MYMKSTTIGSIDAQNRMTNTRERVEEIGKIKRWPKDVKPLLKGKNIYLSFISILQYA